MARRSQTDDEFSDRMINDFGMDDPFETVIPWLPTNTSFSNGKILAFDNKYYKIRMFILRFVSDAVPLFLAKKYHCVNVKALMKDFTPEWNYITWATWFTMVNEAYGIRLYKTINDEIAEIYDGETQIKSTDDAVQDIFNSFAGLNISYKGPSVKPLMPTDTSKVRDFLLGPWILIQLPWKPVILQQWLLGSLAEVLMFEKDSVELRHWPLPARVKDCASQILSLVRDLKQRVVLGFAIIGQMIHVHPENDPKFPNYILHNVVLPSVPVLNFLISGKAHKIVKSIKKVVWTDQSTGDQNSCYVHPSVFTMDKDLEDFHLTGFYSLFTYIGKTFTKVFFKPKFDIGEMAMKIKSKEDSYTQDDFKLKPLGVQEEEVSMHLQRNVQKMKVKQTNDYFISIAVEAINTHVIKSEILPNLKVDDVTKLVNGRRLLFDEIFSDESNVLASAIHQALLWEQVNSFGDSFNNLSPSIFQLIGLQLKSLQREQKVRLAHVCSVLFNMNLQLKENRPKMVVLSVEEMLQQICDAKKEIQEFNQDKLFSQLPSEWRGRINPNELQIKYKPGNKTIPSNAESIAIALQTRIGKLVKNIAETNFDAARRGAELFPHWNIVQYLLPCIVATFMERENDQPLLGFLHHLTAMRNLDLSYDPKNYQPVVAKLTQTLVKHYENSFLVWSAKLKQDVPIPPRVEDSDEFLAITYYRGYSSLILKYREFIRHMLLSHTEKYGIYTQMILGYDQILNYIPHWPLSASHVLFVKRNFWPCLKAWLDFALMLFKDLFNICQTVFKHAIPGKPLSKLPDFEKINFANVVISELELVMTITSKNGDVNENAVDVYREEIPDVPEFYLDQKLLLHRVVATEMQVSSDNVEDSKSLLCSAESALKALLKMYKSLKKFRQDCGPAPNSPHYVNTPYAPNPLVHAAVQSYINGDLEALDRMMSVFKLPYEKKCRQCGKMVALEACQKCAEQRFPDVHYFCSKTCQETCWKATHMEDHEDFQRRLEIYPQL